MADLGELTKLLDENCRGRTRASGKCRDTIKSFLEENVSVTGMDMYFVKKLTTAINNMIENDESDFGADASQLSDTLLERARDYNLQGAEAAINMPKPKMANCAAIRSYFYSRAGNISRLLYKRTDNPAWVRKWYEDKKQSADISRPFDLKHSAHTYSFAGNAAEMMYQRTGNHDWARKWHEAYLTSAELSESFNPVHSAYAYSFAGRAAKTIFFKTFHAEWAKKAVMCYNKSLSLFRQQGSNPEKAAKVMERVKQDRQKLSRYA